MLSTKAWRTRLHKKKLNDAHNVMRLRPEVNVGGPIVCQTHETVIPQPTSETFMQISDGVFFSGDPSHIEDLL